MKPVVAFDDFPSFGNAGARTAPGEAKYAAGFVPADTFPAEWANYFFHGATKGISELNSATRSIWLELENVLLAKNIQPSTDASCTNQLLEALNKIRDEAVALAYPVGTVYINAKCSTLPTSIAQIGTWCAIDGRFLRACSACLGCTGGGSVTLAVCHLPSHCHTTPAHCHSGFNHAHCVDLFSGNVCSGTSGNINNTVWTGGTPYTTTNTACTNAKTGGMDSHASGKLITTTSGIPTMTNDCWSTSGAFSLTDKRCGHAISQSSGNYCVANIYLDISHSHSIGTHYHTLGNHYHKTTGNTSTVGSACNTGSACPTTCNTGSGCSFDIIPSYRDVAMWYRDA